MPSRAPPSWMQPARPAARIMRFAMPCSCCGTVAASCWARLCSCAQTCRLESVLCPPMCVGDILTLIRPKLTWGEAAADQKDNRVRIGRHMAAGCRRCSAVARNGSASSHV